MPEERVTPERMRRLRASENLRGLVRETHLHPSNLVAPIFVREGKGIVEPVEAMPGVSRYSVDQVPKYVERLSLNGINSFLLFGIPDVKDKTGTGAYDTHGVIARAVREIKKNKPESVVITDVCLCEYTSHGHCGVVRANEVIDNDATLPLLARAAVVYAKAGADVVAPSAMMDGQVRALRTALEENGMDDTVIMSYSAKYASSFYGPFRQAAASAPAFGDRKGYQLDPANSTEAMREIANDIQEGADIVMVKPALAYLDIIARARSRFDVPLAAYNVSGEYTMIKSAGIHGWIDEASVVREVLLGIKRAGADIIITYFAEQAATWLTHNSW